MHTYVYTHDMSKINSVSGSLLNDDNTIPTMNNMYKYAGIAICDIVYYAINEQQHNAINRYSRRVQNIRNTSMYRGLFHTPYEQQLYNDIESMYYSICDQRAAQQRMEYNGNRYTKFSKLMIEYQIDLINEYRYRITTLLNNFHDAMNNYNCCKLKMELIRKIYKPKNNYDMEYKRNIAYEKKTLQDYKMIAYKHKFILHNHLQNTYNVSKYILNNLTTYKCMK